MSEYPLYNNNKTPKTVNPVKIIPSLANKYLSNKNTANKPVYSSDGKLYAGILNQNKEKKISKNDNKKHYRTKMCPNGRDCKKRFTCTFAHTQQELRKPFIKRKNPCILYQRGKCSLGSACRDYHGNLDLKKNYKYKEKICQNFLLGNCQKGDVCIFLHEKPSQNSEINQQNIEELNQPQKQVQQIKYQINHSEDQNSIKREQENLKKQEQRPQVKKQNGKMKEIIQQQVPGQFNIQEGGLQLTFNF